MVLTTMAPMSLSFDASGMDGASRHLFEQVESVVHEDFGPFLPAMLPLEYHSAGSHV